MKKTRIKFSPARNYNVKAPKLGGQGVVPPARIASALGVSRGLPVHSNALKQLFSHPDMGISSTARRLYNNMNQSKGK